MSCCFFFQAEDGIRDHCVTGVQTCALPICGRAGQREGREQCASEETAAGNQPRANGPKSIPAQSLSTTPGFVRSEERRVGKECRARGSPDDYKKEMRQV